MDPVYIQHFPALGCLTDNATILPKLQINIYLISQLTPQSPKENFIDEAKLEEGMVSTCSTTVQVGFARGGTG